MINLHFLKFSTLFFSIFLNFDSEAFAQKGIIIDSICVFKGKREMQLFHQAKLMQTMNIGLGKNSKGAKKCQGDGKTPEGLYFIQKKNAKSKYYKSLLISYPNFKDIFMLKHIIKKQEEIFVFMVCQKGMLMRA